jgi:hypothetical protein
MRDQILLYSILLAIALIAGWIVSMELRIRWLEGKLNDAQFQNDKNKIKADVANMSRGQLDGELSRDLGRSSSSTSKT